MIKHVFVFQPAVNFIEADRYYFRFHSKEVVRFLGPWFAPIRDLPGAGCAPRRGPVRRASRQADRAVVQQRR
jgi:hypothetical protein